MCLGEFPPIRHTAAAAGSFGTTDFDPKHIGNLEGREYWCIGPEIRSLEWLFTESQTNIALFLIILYIGTKFIAAS